MQAHESASVQTEAEAWEEERRISKYAENLEQLPCNRKIPMDPKQVSLFSGRFLLGFLGKKTDHGTWWSVFRIEILPFAFKVKLIVLYRFSKVCFI